MSNEKDICKHCGNPLSKFKPPIEMNWGDVIQYVCFNDDCSYYVKGWDWMLEKYNQKVSYRYRYDPETGNACPLPVWNVDAFKDYIIE